MVHIKTENIFSREKLIFHFTLIFFLLKFYLLEASFTQNFRYILFRFSILREQEAVKKALNGTEFFIYRFNSYCRVFSLPLWEGGGLCLIGGMKYRVGMSNGP